MKVTEHTISKHYLPALIIEDYSGLDPDDRLGFESWLKSVSKPNAHWAYDTEALDNTRFTLCEVSDLYSDCLTVKQIYK